ncbi:pyrroloquinoline quinone biosynthesis protein PqqE [bacterium]|nr:pyrroloquinoline quinone biosynthesis protein PqqE [bacterium]|tara:strand:- start:3069 stop:3761 length:693 start_codon:yes stop_codon:yes gene_type:complete
MTIKLAIVNNQPAIFHTLQGEGPYAGTPAVFIRTAVCNLTCTWCDTPYTWDWSRYPKEKHMGTYSISNVCACIQDYNPQHIVFTGGEPLLQQQALHLVLNQLHSEATIEIETNGTKQPIPELDRAVHAYNVSLKLPNSGQPYTACIVPDSVRYFAHNKKAFFKFVVQTPVDIDAIIELATTYAIPHTRIGLMPEGTDSHTLRVASPWVIDACLTHGFRFLDRLHIHIGIA